MPKNVNPPSERDMKRKDRGYSEQRVREDAKVAFVTWNDNKPVHFLSSSCSKFPVEICNRWSNTAKRRINLACPGVVKKYNQQMGGVDLIDRFIATYEVDNKSNYAFH